MVAIMKSKVFTNEDPPERSSIYPILNGDIWDFYKKQQNSIWTAEEIDLEKDLRDFNEHFTDDERKFIMMTLAFFSGFDNLVMKNISVNFENEIPIMEASYFYSVQKYIEGVHSETYSMLIDTLVPQERKHEMFGALESVPSVKKKSDWACTFMDRGVPLGERLLAWAIVEGVFFSGSFCSIFWIKSHKGGKMHGLTFSNELISRDEALHTNFALMLVNRLVDKPSYEKARDIIRSAIEIEKEFVEDALPVSIIGMNKEMMGQYLEYVADHLFSSLGYEEGVVYGSKNPFEFMELISLSGKTNFFEKRVGEYQKAHVAKEGNFLFTVDEDF
jgi:ribonucleotide reductase beta subunit family protein with ferritin-like domain